MKALNLFNPRFLKKDSAILNFLKEYAYVTGVISLNKGRVSIDGDIVFNAKFQAKYTQFPVQFDTVTGLFDCSHSNISDLSGSPTEVGEFMCVSCPNLQDLTGGPCVADRYTITYCDVRSLNGMPGAVDTVKIAFNPNLVVDRPLPDSIGVLLMDKSFDPNNLYRLRKLMFAEMVEPTRATMELWLQNGIQASQVPQQQRPKPWVQLLEDFGKTKNMDRALQQLAELMPVNQPELGV